MGESKATGRRLPVRKVAIGVLGALLLAAGVAALVLPGPGLLLILFGLVVLATEFEWAERRVDAVRDKAFEVAAAGVATWGRVVFSTLSALLVIAAGIFWWYDPAIVEFWVIGPELPFGGWSAGLFIAASGLLALGLIGYSLKRFRPNDG